jgi:hypothetical protein
MTARRQPARLAATAAVAAALVAAAWPGAAGSVTLQRAALGVYEGSGAPSGVTEFAAWLGRRPAYVLDFLARDTWESISQPTWWLQSWRGAPYTMTYSVPMLPERGATLRQGASGAFNRHFRALAASLIEHGQGNAVIRLGWEFNGNWYSWSAVRDPHSFVAYWRQIVKTMRSVPGARFRFDWAPVWGSAVIDPEVVYPGDAFVDYIGLTLFDASWHRGWEDPEGRWEHVMSFPFGLLWHRDFAAAHRKPMSYPEWGLLERDDGHGGGDNPYFIERMHEWLSANRGDIAYHVYFDFSETHGTGLVLPGGVYPRGASRFRELFGRAFPPGRGDGAGQLLLRTQRQAPRVRVRASSGVNVAGGRRLDVVAQVQSTRRLRRVVVRVDGVVACVRLALPLTCRTPALAAGRHVIVVSATDVDGWVGWSGVETTVGSAAIARQRRP